MRHVGDFKQLWVNSAGAASYRYQDNQASLFEGDDRYNFDTYVVGRAFVIHMGQDDEGDGGDAGSMANGNAGARLACCNITLIDEEEFDSLYFRDIN